MPKIPPLPLCESDLANLQASTLTSQTIRAAGLHTKDDALWFPYRDLDGKVNCFARWRPHNPKPGKDGKAPKYLQPKGSPLRAYYPPACLAKLCTRYEPVFITEGEKKALALGQLDVAAVGIGGIYCGCQKTDNGDYELIDDLANIGWKDRPALLVFDYDKTADARRNAMLAGRRLTKALRNAGASEVYNVPLPAGPNGAKQGVDDFLAANGAQAFEELVEKSRHPDAMLEVDAMDLMDAEPVADFEFLPLLGQGGYIVKGFAHILSGSPKVGKTELIYPCLKEWLDAGETILYFTEESKLVWQRRLLTTRILDQRGLVLVFALGVEVDKMLERVKRGTETIVVADTLRGLGILGGDENDNSSVARAVEPWVTACRTDGKSFLGAHHARKSGGEGGKGVSGAHALVGAVDIVLELNRGSADNLRTLVGLGRLIAPPELTYQMLDDGTMAVVAAAGEAPSGDVQDVLPSGPPGVTVDDVIRALRITKTKALFLLTRGITKGQVARAGEGKKGNPFRYWLGG